MFCKNLVLAPQKKGYPNKKRILRLKENPPHYSPYKYQNLFESTRNSDVIILILIY